MNSLELVKSISNIMEEQCKKETNIYGYEIWTYHITSVVKYSKLLAQKLHADMEIVELAALLHDYAGIKDSSLYKEHHIHGAAEAERILKTFDYPQEKIDKIKQCILEHRGSVPIEKTSKESLCVSSADAMAHMSSIPSLLHLAYCQKNMEVSEGAEWVSQKLDRSWNKLCPEAKEIINKTYENAKTVLAAQMFC